MDFVWITNQYDYHLEGLCTYLGQWHRFETHEIHSTLVCRVYTLSPIEKLKWKLSKFFFEKCVGKHYTYQNQELIKDESPPSLIRLKLYYTFKNLLTN